MNCSVMKWLLAALQASARSRGHATRSPPLVLLFATVTLLGITCVARADVVTFAQFNEQRVSEQDFGYTNQSTSATFNSVGQGIPIYLSITSGFAPSLDRLQSAHLFLTSSTSVATMPQLPPDDVARQHFIGTANGIQILLDTPVNGKRDFLTVTFSDGLLSGRLNGTEASLKTSDTDGGNPSVSFVSDFIDFTSAIEHGFSLSFSSVNSSAGGGYLQMGDNGFFRSFTASGTGTFDTAFPAAAPVPEPSSLVFAGLGFLGLLGLSKRLS
jgi:hypothetical protein